MGISYQGELISAANCVNRQAVRTRATGEPPPAHCHSLGEAILAGLSPELSDQSIAGDRLVRHTTNTMLDSARPRTELGLISNRGHAIDNEEIEMGLLCIGAPVGDYSATVVAAISIAGPGFSMRRPVPDLIRYVTEAAGRLPGSLSYSSEAEPSASSGRRRFHPDHRAAGAVTSNESMLAGQVQG